MIGAGAGLTGHIEIADKIIIAGKATISKSLKEPGVYSSALGFMKHQDWQKNVVRFRQLDKLARRLQELERKLDKLSKAH